MFEQVTLQRIVLIVSPEAICFREEKNCLHKCAESTQGKALFEH